MNDSFIYIIIFGLTLVALVVLCIIMLIRLTVFNKQIEVLTSFHEKEVQKLTEANDDFKKTGALDAVSSVNGKLQLLSTSITSMSESNNGMVKNIAEIGTHYSEVKRLAGIIGNNFLSGKWGEENLEHLLSRTLPPDAFSTQKRNSLKKIPDFSIPFNFNGEPSMLFIDSKMNLTLIEKFKDALSKQDALSKDETQMSKLEHEATITKEVQEARNELRDALNTQVKKINNDYRKAPESLPFSIMYVGVDSWVNLIYTHFSEDVALWQKENHVVIMGPIGMVPVIKLLHDANAHAREKNQAFANFGLIYKAILEFQKELEKLCAAVAVPENNLSALSLSLHKLGTRVQAMDKELKIFSSVVITHIPIPETKEPENKDDERTNGDFDV